MVFDTIDEDTIQCFFFSSSQKCDISYWEQLCDSINKTIEILSEGYLWHRDVFKVCYPIYKKDNKAMPEHLISATCFGDNIEDEWFIVYLILEITKQFKDIIVQIKDNDGDFLLIEAADYLPSWAKPENTENRVFIYNHHIHIIPPSVVKISSRINLKDALKLVINCSEQTRASVEIDDAILRRIGDYPDKIKKNNHRALVHLPVQIGALLTIKPSLISSLVNAYCYHDMIDAKSCNKIHYENCVTVELKFTKCLYAMLLHLNPLKNNKFANISDKKSILGLKLIYGYEMIMKDSSADIFTSKEFNKFLNSLKDSGYFKDNLEGSNDYKCLLENAKRYFSMMECPIKSNISSTILQLMATPEFMQIKESLIHQPAIDADYVEDSDEWLNINSEQLNDFLNTHYGKKAKLDDVVTAESITSKLCSFFKETSDFEGIETTEIEKDDKIIEFNSNEFISSLQKMLNSNCNVDENDLSDDFNSFDDDDDDDHDDDIISNELEQELKTKLFSNRNDNVQETTVVLENIAKGIKEEGGFSGPSSNLLKTIGIKKTDVLDSDDDEQ